MQFVLRWWLILEIIGWLALPLSRRVFRWLPDQGYTLSKSFGLLLAGYFLWLGASTNLLYNDVGGILAAFGLVAAISAVILWKFDPGKNDPELSFAAYLKDHRRLIITAEALFFIALVVWAGLRAYAPGKIMNAGGEKFMEIAFMNGILNSQTFPPLDPWLSGFSISYYYFGYVLMAMLTRLSAVPAGVGFDLSDAMLFSLTALGAFGVAYNLITLAMRRLQGGSGQGAVVPGRALLFGLLGMLFTTLLSNLEGVFEVLQSRGLLSSEMLAWLDIPDLAKATVTHTWLPDENLGWWWWRGSRVLQDYNLLGQRQFVSPITEFPFFSFLLGDNHPHVLGLPFVLLAVAFALNLLENRLRTRANQSETGSASPAWWNPAAFCLDNDWLLFFSGALLLGGLAFNNTWDFPIYLGLTILVYTAGQLAGKAEVQLNDLIKPVVLAVGWLFTSILMYIFFYASFSSQAGGILPYIFPPTRLVQYLVMFGPFIFILSAFLLLYVLIHRVRWRAIAAWWLRIAGVGVALILVAALALVLSGIFGGSSPLLKSVQDMLGGAPWGSVAATMILDRITQPWMFLLLAGLIALSLGALFSQLPKILPAEPEAGSSVSTRSGLPVLPQDIFVFVLVVTALALTWFTEFFYLRDSFGLRMNTIFKFYYQAWILFATATVYGVWWISEQRFFSTSLHSLTRIFRNIARVGALVMVMLGLVYTVLAANSRVAGFRYTPDINGESALAHSNQDDWAAIQWLKDNAAGQNPIPVILEAPGKSYNYEGRISAFSGLPTVLGWAYHEGQWRGTYTEQDKREPDIQTIYTTSNASRALELLHKWNVTYVVLGQTERDYIAKACQTGSCALNSALRKFNAVLKPVFNQGSITIYSVP